MLRLVTILAGFIFLITSLAWAFDPGCIAGGCEQSSQEQTSSSGIYNLKNYECVCPPKDTVKTAIDVLSVLTLPFHFFSSKPDFYTGGMSLADLIKNGCRCRPKPKRDYSQEENDNAIESEQKINILNMQRE